MQGRAAVQALGDRLESVAARNDLTARGLERLLTQDRTSWLSAEGQLFYTEEAPAEITNGATGVTALATLATTYPTTETFALHSRPGSTRKIFLDFDGATVQGTGWNTGKTAITDGAHIGWDSDGSPSTFSTTEHGWIQEVWRQVAETYSAFDVDVTTEDPGPASYTRSSLSDTSYGTHVVITSSSLAKSQACGTCLGIAWVGTFDFVDAVGYYQPAWVFADDPRFAPMIVAQSIAHETGHTLGLQHDGTATEPYYYGTSAWGPVMGGARTRAVSQFSKGEYSGANNTEDDLSVIRAHGLPLRTDDHGSTTAAANQLGALPAYDVNGIVSSRSDQDVFAIDLPCTTDLSVSATGVGEQTTLDLSLEVLNASGSRVGYSSPASSWSGTPPVSNGMNAQVTVPAATGTYYLRVDGVGYGNPAGSGWSDYGSIGQYRLTSNGCATIAPPAISDPGTTDPSTTTSSPTPTATPTATATPAPTPTPTPTPTATPKVNRPAAPVIRTASSGRRGGAVTAVTRWAVPTSNGGAPVTKYRVLAQRLNSSNRVVRSYGSSYLGATTRALTMRLPKGRYVFKVMAWNRIGSSSWSRASNIVRAR